MTAMSAREWAVSGVISVTVTALVLTLTIRGPGKSNARTWAAMAVVGACFAASLVMFGRIAGYDSPIFGVTLLMAVLGEVALLRGLVGARMARQPAVAGWEVDGAFYRVLGVELFGHLLRRWPLRHLNSSVYVDRNRRGLTDIDASMRAAEAVHFWALVLTAPFIAYWIVRGWFNILQWAVGFHLLLNVYPILHLRHVRGRVERLMERARARGRV